MEVTKPVRLDPRAPLVLDTRELGRRPGSQRTVAFSTPAPADLGIEVLKVPEGSPVALELRLEAVMEGVLVTGTASAGRRLALLTVELADATGYGRIVREAPGDAGSPVRAIVEHKDASHEQRAIREVYTGMMAAPTAQLLRWLAALSNDNAQREYYLTDVVAMAVAEGVPVVAAPAASETEVLGVNSPAQLAELEHALGLSETWKDAERARRSQERYDELAESIKALYEHWEEALEYNA